MKQWYEKLFEWYAEQYDQESDAKGTLGEVDFIEPEIKGGISLSRSWISAAAMLSVDDFEMCVVAGKDH
jgi:hypothetical protein